MTKTIFNPTKKNLSEIKEWLEKEYQETGEGFLVNWDVIEDAFEKNRLIACLEDNQPIGFLVYKILDEVSVIVIAEIHPSRRKDGGGRKLVEDSLKYFERKGAMVTQLNCSPASTERVWKKLGFLNYPKFHSENRRTGLYKILVDSLPFDLETSPVKETIEVWNPLNYNDSESKWSWNIDFKDNSRILTKPIVFPADYNWRMKWSKGKDIYFDDEIHRFDKIDFSSFLIIEKL